MALPNMGQIVASTQVGLPKRGPKKVALRPQVAREALVKGLQG